MSVFVRVWPAMPDFKDHVDGIELRIIHLGGRFKQVWQPIADDGHSRLCVPGMGLLEHCGHAAALALVAAVLAAGVRSADHLFVDGLDRAFCFPLINRLNEQPDDNRKRPDSSLLLR